MASMPGDQESERWREGGGAQSSSTSLPRNTDGSAKTFKVTSLKDLSMLLLKAGLYVTSSWDLKMSH